MKKKTLKRLYKGYKRNAMAFWDDSTDWMDTSLELGRQNVWLQNEIMNLTRKNKSLEEELKSKK
jgi:hypothetical protein